jgi:hypothetical protein
MRVSVLAGDEGAGGRRVTEPDSEIKPFGDQVADCVAGHQFQSQLRIVLQERRQMSGEHQAREKGVDVHAQTSPHDFDRAGRFVGRFLDLA